MADVSVDGPLGNITFATSWKKRNGIWDKRDTKVIHGDISSVLIPIAHSHLQITTQIFAGKNCYSFLWNNNNTIL